MHTYTYVLIPPRLLVDAAADGVDESPFRATRIIWENQYNCSVSTEAMPAMRSVIKTPADAACNQDGPDIGNKVSERDMDKEHGSDRREGKRGHNLHRIAPLGKSLSLSLLLTVWRLG
jgi:hypothetical protein